MTLIEKVALLRDAIVNHKQVTAMAVNHPREFCPHLLGRNSEGAWSILVWQFAGSSEKGLPPEGGWRCFHVIDLFNTLSKVGVWHRGFYSGRSEQHCVKQIETVIDSAHSAEIRETFGGRIRERGLQPPRRRK